MDQRELFHVAQITESAILGKVEQCAAYVRNLADTLDSSGNHEAADRLRKILEGRKVKAAKVSRAKTNGIHRLPVDAESALSIADREQVVPGSVELVLSEENGNTTQQFIKYVQQADKLKAAGVPTMPSLLVYGPPGCGKTCSAKYIAGELGLPLITARSDALISSFLGSTSKNVRKLFDYAHSQPCVLFLDEFDAIAKKRDDSRELGELKRVVISLLQNIDAFDGEHVLIAATNHEHLLDTAIWRRFAYKLHLQLPDTAARAKLLRSHLSSRLPEGAEESLAILADGLSGAQLKLAADECVRGAVISDTDVAIEDIANALLSEAGYSVENRTDLIIQLNSAKKFNRTEIAKIAGVSAPYVTKVLKKECSNGK